MRVLNILDRRFGWTGEWWSMPLVFEELGDRDVGRTVLYLANARNKQTWGEAGTLVRWSDEWCFVRYGHGDTLAATSPGDLVFGVWPLDGPGIERVFAR